MASPESRRYGETAAEQARQALGNLHHLIEAGAMTSHAIVKTTIFLTDMNDFAAVNEVYAEFFEKPYPARSTVAVAALPKGALVEIEAIDMHDELRQVGRASCRERVSVVV